MEGLNLYEVRNLKKSYGKLKVIDDISFDIEIGKTTYILGPSGCGKTTLFKILLGSLGDYKGKVKITGKPKISCVFQKHTLIPWKTVYDNMEFVLRDVMSKNDAKERINMYLHKAGIEKFKRFYPKELSGGMAQRVNILRAFAYPSDVIFMDEPFKSLDMKTKLEMEDMFSEIIRDEKRTAVVISHDAEEALKFADKIIILSNKPSCIKAVLFRGGRDFNIEFISHEIMKGDGEYEIL